MKRVFFERICILLFTFLFPLITCAQVPLGGTAGSAPSVGEISDTIRLGPMVGLHHFMNGMFLIVGFIAMYLGMKRYRGYWVSPQECPLTYCIGYFIVGILLMLIPFLYYLTGIKGLLG